MVIITDLYYFFHINIIVIIICTVIIMIVVFTKFYNNIKESSFYNNKYTNIDNIDSLDISRRSSKKQENCIKIYRIKCT